jgi:hypothetical protein
MKVGTSQTMRARSDVKCKSTKPVCPPAQMLMAPRRGVPARPAVVETCCLPQLANVFRQLSDSGEPVTVQRNETTSVRGVVVDLTADGVVTLQDDDGRLHFFSLCQVLFLFLDPTASTNFCE